MNRVNPYVYQLIHKITGEFYFGSRWANKLNAVEDLGHKYFTSSKVITPVFREFDTVIIAEFFDKEDAYRFEQDLIKEHWKHPLLLNKGYQGRSGIVHHKAKHSEETKLKIGLGNKGKKGKPCTQEHKDYLRRLAKENGWRPPNRKGIALTPEHKRKISIGHTGKHVDEWTGSKNPKYKKGYLIAGEKNPNAKKWELYCKETGQTMIINDLVGYAKENNMRYSTVYSWQNQYINGIQRLRKIEE